VRTANNLTIFMCRLSWNLGVSTSWNPQGLSRHVMGLIYLYLHLYWSLYYSLSEPRERKGRRFEKNSTKSEICGLLEFYAEQNSNWVLKLRDNLTVPASRSKQSEKNDEDSSRNAWPLKKEPSRCPEKSVRNYHSALRKIQEKGISHLWRKSQITHPPNF